MTTDKRNTKYLRCFEILPANRRDAILTNLRKEGVHCGGCGDTAVRLRPALTFNAHHAQLFTEKLHKVLAAF